MIRVWFLLLVFLILLDLVVDVSEELVGIEVALKFFDASWIAEILG